jgi:hypothetical protein
LGNGVIGQLKTEHAGDYKFLNCAIAKLPISGFGGEHIADAADGIALCFAESEELEAVAQALAVADDGANFQRVGTKGQRVAPMPSGPSSVERPQQLWNSPF